MGTVIEWALCLTVGAAIGVVVGIAIVGGI